MQTSRRQLQVILEKSAFLYERRLPCFQAANTNAADDELAVKRLARWKQVSSWNEEETFRRRLQFDGLTTATALSLLAGVRCIDETIKRPLWMEFLESALEECARVQEQDPLALPADIPFLDASTPLAFEQLWAPFVIAASRKLRASVPQFDRLLSATAVAQFERNLAQWIAAVSAETVELEFTVFRSMRTLTGQAFGTGALTNTPESTQYSAFVQAMWRGKLASFLEEYAVLARLIGTLMEMWVSATHAFLEHLSQDGQEIALIFLQSDEQVRVSRVELGLSDRHCGGRTSFLVHFDTGLSLVYKPKNLDSEELYYGLLGWINAKKATLDFPVFRALYRKDHGWVEIVEHKPCVDLKAVERYYHRAGMLVCLMYCLEASDCHHENIIANGEYPVLIDMETIVQHRVAVLEGADQEDAASTANRVFYWDSVFRTALLPRWEFGPAGESYDISGLGGSEEQLTPFKKKAWQHINTDGMKLKREAIRTAPSKSLVFFEGRKIAAAEYLPNIIDGFDSMYRLLQECRSELFAENGPLFAMRQLPLRFLYRHTKIYTAVLNSFLQPDYLRDGADASIQVDVLSRPLLHTEDIHPFWRMIAVEEAAVLRADIPFLTSSADTTELHLDDGSSLPGFFGEPSYQVLQERFRNLSDADRHMQVAYLRTSFATPADLSTPAVHTGGTKTDLETELQESDFTAEALKIANEIADAAIRSQDGSATWITMAYFPEAQRWQLQPMTPRMYDGACGTVLFLAAAAKMFDSHKLADAAVAGLKQITTALDSTATARLLVEAGIGAGLGAGSLTYSLAIVSKFLESSAVLSKAEESAALLTEQRIQADQRLDLLGGAAGALLCLLAFYRATKQSWALNRAIACGEHLLARAVEMGDGIAWPTLGSAPLLGLSHGAAGIAYALIRLSEVTLDSKWRDLAARACQYEDSLFSEEQGNWPDLRFPKNKFGYVFQNSWCHGATGITLARLGSTPAEREAYASDIYRGLKATRLEPLMKIDHLCCGNLGRVETLLVGGSQLNQPEHLADAKKLASQVLNRARKRGCYGLGFDGGPYLPSFHQGMAGIGYQFLRMADPKRFPSLLLWESVA